MWPSGQYANEAVGSNPTSHTVAQPGSRVHCSVKGKSPILTWLILKKNREKSRVWYLSNSLMMIRSGYKRLLGRSAASPERGQGGSTRKGSSSTLVILLIIIYYLQYHCFIIIIIFIIKIALILITLIFIMYSTVMLNILVCMSISAKLYDKITN